ncbi:MAG: glycosyl hydrolase [Acidobacteriia bacterium]|nr:glycosyl hydrolase [Terriglobia bacterium]
MEMRVAAALIILLFSTLMYAQKAQNSKTDVSLRGISAVSSKVAWASGAKGTVLRTIDGGETWETLAIVGADSLDFRDIQAFDQNTAFVLSIEPGDQSRIYKTADGGKIWQRQFTNSDPKAFYDCFAFWDSTHGIAISDSVDGKFPLVATSDGMTWNPVAVKNMPAALPSEGAFAASGTCIATFGKNDVWFGTGGPAARVFHSADRGKNWTVVETPIIHGAASQGIFSLAFWTAKDGVAVGGDYKEPKKGESVATVTHDGGKTWTLASKQPHGYRSAVAISASHTLAAVGTSGADVSQDGGNSWTPMFKEDLNALALIGNSGWAVGPGGKIVVVDLKSH